jgi:hypothetical protein
MRPKRTQRSKRPAWLAKTATASDIVSIIRDVLAADYLDDDPHTLRMVAQCLANAFDFSDEEGAAFVKWAMANHEGEAEEEDDD